MLVKCGSAWCAADNSPSLAHQTVIAGGAGLGAPRSRALGTLPRHRTCPAHYAMDCDGEFYKGLITGLCSGGWGMCRRVDSDQVAYEAT